MSPAPIDTAVKSEPLEPEDRQGDGRASIQLPPHSVTVKTEVKKEVEEENGKGHDRKKDDANGPCTKMTMRLRRNLNNPQCVSTACDTKLWQIVNLDIYK